MPLLGFFCFFFLFFFFFEFFYSFKRLLSPLKKTENNSWNVDVNKISSTESATWSQYTTALPVQLEVSSEPLVAVFWLTAWRHQHPYRGAFVSDTRARPSRLASFPWGLSRAGARGPLDVWLALLPLSSNGPFRTWTGRTSPRRKKAPRKTPLAPDKNKREWKDKLKVSGSEDRILQEKIPPI